MRSWPRRALGLAGTLLLWLALLAIALLASIALHLRLPLARRVAVQLIHSVVSDEIRGALQIGVLERVSEREIVARDVVLFDGENRRVIVAERLVLVPDLRALREGRVRFGSAKLDGARVWLYPDEEGLPSLIASFDSAHPSPTPSKDPLHVEVAGIELARVTLEGGLLGLDGLRANVASARGHLDIGGDVHVRIDSAHGNIVEPFPYAPDVLALSGTISTVADEGVDLRARTRYGEQQANARVRFATPRGRPQEDGVLTIEVQGERLTTTALQGLGYDFIPDLDSEISGQFTLRGPIEDLTFAAVLDTQAGPARAYGRITESGTQVSIRSASMQLAKLRTGVPDVTVSGVLHIDAPPEPEVLGAPEPDTRLRLELDPLAYLGMAVPSFSVQGVLTGTSVRIDSAESKAAGASIDARGEVSLEGAIDLQVRASFPDIGRDPNLKLLVPDAHGRLDADVRLESPAPEPGFARSLRFAGRLALAGLRYGAFEAERLLLSGSARGDPEHPALQLDLRGKQVRFGDYALGDPSLKLRGGPREYKAEGEFLAAGRRTFNASATITAERGGFTVNADPIEFAVGDGSWRGALQNLRIDPGQSVELTLLRLASRSQRLEARGIVRTHGEDNIEAQLQDFDLQALHALLGGRLWLSSGRADAHVQLKGDLERPDLLIQGALRDGEVMEVAGVNALYFITYGSGRIEADGEIDLGERGMMQLSGGASVDPSIRDPIEALRYGSYDLDVSTQALSIALAPAIARAGMRGHVSGNLRLRGTLDNPDLRGALELDPLEAPGWSPLRVTAQGVYSGGALSLHLSLADERGALGNADGRMELDWAEITADPKAFGRVLMAGPWQVSGESVARKLNELPEPLAKFAPYPAAISTQFALRKQDGKTSGQLSFSGGWEAEQREGTCASSLRARLRGSLALEGETTTFELVAISGATRVGVLKGTLDTPVDRWVSQGRATRPKLFRASGRVEIGALQRLPYLCEFGTGSVRAEFELDGGLSAEPILVAAIDAKLNPRIVRQDRRKAVRVRSCQRDPIRAHLELNADRNDMRVRGGTDGCHGGPIELEALLPVVWDEWLVLPSPCPDRELSASVRFKGAQLKPLLDRVPGVKNSDVLAHGEIRVKGLPGELDARGRVVLADGKLYLVPTGQELTDISAALDFRGNWAKLEHLRAKQERGSIASSGGIAFNGFRPERVRIAVRTDALQVRREGLDMGQVTASAAIDAEIKPEKARAEIMLHNLLLRLPDASNRALQPLAPHPDVTIVTATPEPRPMPYPIELMIKGQRQLTVQRNDFRADVGLELALAYLDPDLNVGGRIAFLGGQFEAFGQRFEINSGALRFDGSSELDPDVYLIATQKPEGSVSSPVVVSVTGTLSEPIVTFSSDQCPGDLGAITYLVSGRCAADDPDLAEESDDARAAVTTGILSGVLTLGVQSQLTGDLPRIAFESGRVRAGISSQALIPKFMRGLVQRVYIQGGVPLSDQDQQQQPGTTVGEQGAGLDELDFLIELYFPHSIVGSGRFGEDSWGLDVTWEP